MTGPTLQDVLRLPRWRDVAVLAGGDRLDTPVAGVATFRDLDLPHRGTAESDPNPDPAGARLLMALDPLEATDWRLDVLLRRVADDAPGVLVVTSQSPLVRSTSMLAERLGVPVLGAATDLVEMAVEARVALSHPMVVTAEMLLDLGRRFRGRAPAPDIVTRTLADLLGDPVAVTDPRGDVVAGSLPVPVNPDDLSVPMALDVGTSSDVRVLLHPVHLPGTQVPKLWLAVTVPTSTGDHRRGQVAAVVQHAGDALQRWLLLEQLDLERSVLRRTSLLANILQVRDEGTPEIRRRTAEAGWPLDGWHVGFCVGAFDEADVAGRRTSLLDALAGGGLSPVAVERENGWIGWISQTHEPTAEEIQRMARTLRQAHRALQRSLPSYAGVGRPHAGVSGLVETLGEASEAARLAAVHPEDGYFIHVDRLGAAQLLLAWTRTATFAPAARALLEPIITLSGELVETLGAYLDCQGSIVDTAAVLGVHRNTITARMQRITTRLDPDLGNRDNRLAFQLACRTLLGPQQYVKP